jgi:hypothetical protein
MRSRRLTGGAAAIFAAMALGACGVSTGSSPSSLDPASAAPASSVVYMSITVRPQGTERTQVEAGLHKLFGARAGAVIQREVNRLLRQTGTSYNGDVQKWLGQRIALVITALPPGAFSTSGSLSGGGVRKDIALIAPTSDPADAGAFIKHAVRHSPGAIGAVLGGRYAVLGGSDAYHAVAGVLSGGASLASAPRFRSTMAGIGAAPLVAGYVNLHDYVAALAAMPQMQVFGSVLRSALSRSGRGVAGFGVSVNARTVALDVASGGIKQHPGGSPASVSGLPGDAWLALAGGNGLGSWEISSSLRLGLEAAIAHSHLPAFALAGIEQRIMLVEHEILPALGPLSLSVSGTNPLGISAGLEMKPASLPAATRLLAQLRALLAKQPSLQVSGPPTNFSALLPTGSRAQVAVNGGRVVLTYGFADQGAFLHPAAPLAASAVYRQASAQLPAGASVPMYLAFGPITSIVQLTDHSPSATKTLTTLRRLSYLIAGSAPGHLRVVLGLN